MAKKKNVVKVETRKDEVRYVTSDIKKMLGKFLVKSLKRTWSEAFADEGTGEVVNIDCHEIIFDAGTYLGQEEISKINFYMQEGSIQEVEVSNQRRMAFEMTTDNFIPYMAQVLCDMKKKKFLLKAQSIDQAREIVKDFTELNFKGSFRITQIKEFDYCIILVDKLSTTPLDELGKLVMENSELYSDEEIKKICGEDKADIPESKFYNIDARIIFTAEGKDEDKEETNRQFVVQTYTAERAIMLINRYLNDEQDKLEEECKEKNRGFDRKIIHASIEQSTIIPISQYIPKEFSLAYATEE